MARGRLKRKFRDWPGDARLTLRTLEGLESAYPADKRRIHRELQKYTRLCRERRGAVQARLLAG
jgi:hypothetical protein